MEENIIKIADNIFLHEMDGERFKTNFVAGFFLSDLCKEKITINALIPAVLMSGTENLPTLKDINSRLDDLYGAAMDASSDKIGDKQALQFYITTIDDKYALNGENLLEDSIKLLLELIYNPKLIDGKFSKEYVDKEKENLKELIKARVNEKSQYAVSRCIEEMFKGEPYGVYKYGNIEDLENINSENLYEQYKWLLKNSEIHFYVSSSSKIDEKWFDICKTYSNSNVKKNNEMAEFKAKENVLDIVEKQDVTQGKLVLGYNLDINVKEDLYKVQVYNAILGSSSNSKMFQNVREKESLAYTARSMFIKHKSVMLVFAGIEIDKHDKALEIIEKQVDDMKKGEFSDEDIRDAKVFLENIMNSYKDSQDILIDLSLGQIIMDMHDSIEDMKKKINSVTREDILYVANRVHLNTKYFLTAKND